MRILLLDPPGKNKGLNTGLGYLSATLKGHHDVSVLDLNNIEMGICGDPNPDLPVSELEERVIRAIDEFKPDLFGVSVKTFTSEISSQIFRLAKTREGKMRTIAGGPHVTLDGRNFLEENSIDYGIRGEGEYTTLDLCRALEEDREPQDVDGLLYWKDGQLIDNPAGPVISELDTLPLPVYDNFSSVIENSGALKEYPLLTSRGCPYKCTYCSMPKIMGSKWRSHSPERVIDELKDAKNKYRSTSVAIVDDNFTLSLKRVESICDLWISEKLNLPWNSQNGIRADRLNEHLAGKMKQSGCRYVWIGIENADEEVFDHIHKGEKLDEIKRGIKYLKKAGIRVGGFFITGLPYSTREADLKSVDFVKENGIDAWWFSFVPYPHTEAWNWVQANGRVLRPIKGVLQYGSNEIEPVYETDQYPRELQIRTYNEIHVRLHYFDRMADPSLKQWEKWSIIFKKIRPYGYGTVIFFLAYILKFNVRLAVNIIKK